MHVHYLCIPKFCNHMRGRFVIFHVNKRDTLNPDTSYFFRGCQIIGRICTPIKAQYTDFMPALCKQSAGILHHPFPPANAWGIMVSYMDNFHISARPLSIPAISPSWKAVVRSGTMASEKRPTCQSLCIAKTKKGAMLTNPS